MKEKMTKSQSIVHHNSSVPLPFVISLPHCSSRVPGEIRSTFALSDKQIEESTDVGTKEIFGSIPAKAVVSARWSRLLVDLNRGPDQLNSKGVIALKDYHGRVIYREDCIPDKQETERRLKKYYRPFHDHLRAALDDKDIKGLFDCHSLNGIGPLEAPDAGKKRRDIILSNNGDETGDQNPALGKTTCPAETLYMIREAFRGAGFSVSINNPYAGGFITTHYGGIFSGTGRIAVQMEINQDLYLEPGTMRLETNKLKSVRDNVFRSFKEIARELLSREFRC
ncbi:MAG: N-formylglutamate amidohydrolase [Deltaproteobacteria bacterium]|nr:N-formylglutamate amidohydrolase [Deltaproteobacteria bacterium]MBW2343086.1 N-formylglutamate amidohydrolase [Deltaproteobacteria bacterium]